MTSLVRLTSVSSKILFQKLSAHAFEDLTTIRLIEQWLIRKRGYVIRMPRPNTPVILSFSGGLDSTVLLGLLVEKFHLVVYPFYVADQPRSEREIKSAQEIIRVVQKRAPGAVQPLVRYHNSLVGAWAYRNTELDVTQRGLINTIVDFRQQASLLHAHYLYKKYGIRIPIMLCGIQYDDSRHNPAQTLTGMRTTMFNMCVKTGVYDWQFFSLFLEKEFGYLFDKDELVRIGQQLKLPLELTWSCFRRGEQHCGRCGNCKTRMAVFQKAGIKDQTIYRTHKFAHESLIHFGGLRHQLVKRLRRKLSL